MKWPVTRDEKGETGLLFLELSEIIKISTQSNRLLFHTKDAVYYQPDSLDRIESALKAVGLPFERADRGHIIDVLKIVEIDDRKAVAYFEGPSPEERKSATISQPKLKVLIAKLRELKRLVITKG